jgi:hypothetical protein
MSDEFCAGVQILLKRMESNPDEFKEEHGRWSSIRNAVFMYKEQGERNAWLRGLKEAEIDALYEKFVSIHRSVLDEWVMKQVLAEPEEGKPLEAYQMAQGKRIGTGWNDPRMLAQVTVGGSGGSGLVQTKPGGVLMQNNTQVKPMSVMSKLKRELGL